MSCMKCVFWPKLKQERVNAQRRRAGISYAPAHGIVMKSESDSTHPFGLQNRQHAVV